MHGSDQTANWAFKTPASSPCTSSKCNYFDLIQSSLLYSIQTSKRTNRTVHEPTMCHKQNHRIRWLAACVFVACVLATTPTDASTDARWYEIYVLLTHCKGLQCAMKYVRMVMYFLTHYNSECSVDIEPSRQQIMECVWFEWWVHPRHMFVTKCLDLQMSSRPRVAWRKVQHRDSESFRTPIWGHARPISVSNLNLLCVRFLYVASCLQTLIAGWGRSQQWSLATCHGHVYCVALCLYPWRGPRIHPWR